MTVDKAEPTEVVDETKEPEVIDTAAETEKAFLDGFKEVKADDTPEPKKEPKPKKQAVKATEPPVETPPEKVEVTPEPEKVVLAGLTESQIKSALVKAQGYDELEKRLTKTHDMAFGRIGAAEQALKDLKEARATGQPTKITKEQLKRVEDAYGEEYATALAEDLSGLVLSQQPASTFDPSELESRFEKKLIEASQTFELKLLARAHPDWKEKRASDDFKLWTSTLPPETQDFLVTTWDSNETIAAFDAFDKWKADGKSTTNKRNDKRLAAAVVPKGDQQPAARQSDDEEHTAFVEAFNS